MNDAATRTNKNPIRTTIIWGLFVVVAISLGVFSYRFTREFVQTWVITELGTQSDFTFLQPTPANNPDQPTPAPGETAIPTPITEVFDIPEPYQGAEPVSVLLMGIDYRDWESGEGAPRTDSMMLLTIDPLANTAGIISIPRDLFVSIPGFKNERINVAYRYGEIYELPGGGPRLAIQTVEQLLGITIQYYAVIDFSAFVRMIDEIDGLKLDVPESIRIDPIGPGNAVILEPGIQVLPGEYALAYARARNTSGGDFDRAQRQQQVLLAIRTRVLEFDMIPTLLAKAPVLYQELSAGIRTNMPLNEAISIGWLAKDIPDDRIKRGVISNEYVTFVTTEEGDQVLKPLPDKIRTLRDEIFGTANLASPLANLTPIEQAQAEEAVIIVYNGTNVNQLAGRTITFLNGLGLSIPDSNAGNAEPNYGLSMIIDYTGNPYTLRFLKDTLQIQDGRIIHRFDPNSTVDVELYVGADWANAGILP